MENVENEKDSSVDEVLTSVSDEILRKRKRKRQISFSIISAVVLALAIVIITLGCVRVDLRPYFLNEASKYSVIIDGQTKATFVSDDENYDKFYQVYENSFNSSYLTAIFTGKVKNYTVEQTKDNFYYTYSNNVGSGMSSTLSNALGNNYVHVYYGVEQLLYNSDGTACMSKYNTSEQLKFVDVYFTLNTENHDSELTFYFGAYGYSQPRITKITVRANTYNIYDFVENL